MRERGSREYNLALGQKRAEAVKRASVCSRPREQVESVSLGEEKPRCADHSEECWAQIAAATCSTPASSRTIMRRLLPVLVLLVALPARAGLFGRRRGAQSRREAASGFSMA